MSQKRKPENEAKGNNDVKKATTQQDKQTISQGMEYRRAGESDLRVSTLGFGCWQFGQNGANDYWGLEYTQTMANDLVKLAVEAGISYFDTAQDYAKGKSEEQLGVAVKTLGIRNKVVIGSKILPNNCNEVEKYCQDTLDRLQIDCIDLYMVHWPIDQNSMAHFAAHTDEGKNRDYSKVDADAVGDIPPTVAAFKALKALQEAGKIKHIGVSNFGVSQLKEALATGVKIAVNQLCYNLIFRAAEFEILPFCQEHGIGVIAYSPLMQGILTGRWSKADDVPLFRARTRHFSSKRPKSRHGEDGHESLLFKTLSDLKQLAEEEQISMLDLSIAWPLHASTSVCCVVTGVTSAKYIDSNCKAIRTPLSVELMKKVDEVTKELKEAMGGNCDLWQGNGGGRIM